MKIGKDNMTKVIRRTRKVPNDHIDTLLGQRNSGSQWAEHMICKDVEEIRQIWSKAEIVQVKNGCTYARLESSTPLGKIGYATVTQLNDDAEVVVEEGAHGLELRLVGVGVGAEASTTEANIIIGEHEGEEVIFTCYPGPVTDKIPDTFWEGKSAGDYVSKEDIQEGWAIKFGGAE